MPDRPGLDPYSNEWMAEHATDVPGPLMDSVLSVARGWWIEGADVNVLSRTILSGLKKQLEAKHELSNGQTVEPVELRFNGTSFAYVGKAEDGKYLRYEVDDIVRSA